MENRYRFRAKCLDKGEWVYGGYYEVDGNAVILHRSRGNDMQHTAVDPSTVGQWTGRTDSLGTDVYEGDKVMLHDWGKLDKDIGVSVIEWDVDEDALRPNPCYCISDYYDMKRAIQKGRVVGNIHEPSNTPSVENLDE